MLELMTWSEIIENLKLEGSLKLATIFDLNGTKIAETDGAMLSEGEAVVILKCMAAVSSNMYGLVLAGTKFNCINVDKDTLIGQGEGDVIVAHRNRNMLICAISGIGSKTSCLGTVKTFVGRLHAEGAPEVSVPSLM